MSDEARQGSMEQAEGLRRAGRFAEAAGAFDSLWQARPSAEVAWRLAYCLRKQGRATQAAEVTDTAIERFPSDRLVRSERFWALAALVREAKGQGRTGLPEPMLRHVDEMIALAEPLLQSTPDPSRHPAIVFGVCAGLKLAGRLVELADWCARLDPARLAGVPVIFGGRRGLSDLERWYYLAIQAALALGRWSEVRDRAREAAKRFGANPNFPRWAAIAIENIEGAAAGLAEIEATLRRPNCPWYVLAEAARLALEAGRRDDAWRLACRAALAPGEDRHKVKLFEQMARMAPREEAAAHLALAMALRIREGWNAPASLDASLRELAIDGDGVFPTIEDPRPLRRQLATLWRTCLGDVTTSSEVRRTGTVVRLHANGRSGHLRPDGGGPDVFFVLEDIPATARSVGARVSFVIAQSFDRRRQRESVRATELRHCVGASTPGESTNAG